MTLRPVRAKDLHIRLLPLQGAEYREHLYPGCYPGLYDESLSGLEFVKLTTKSYLIDKTYLYYQDIFNINLYLISNHAQYQVMPNIKSYLISSYI